MFADIVVPRGLDNQVAIKIVAEHVQKEMDCRGFRLREQLGTKKCNGLVGNVVLMENNQGEFADCAILQITKDGLAKKENMYAVVMEKHDWPSLYESFTNSVNEVGVLSIGYDPVTHDPILTNANLKSNLNNTTVLIAANKVDSGASALMAIRVLLDHGAKEENIIIATMICSVLALHSINAAFPKVTVVASVVLEQRLEN